MINEEVLTKLGFDFSSKEVKDSSFYEVSNPLLKAPSREEYIDDSIEKLAGLQRLAIQTFQASSEDADINNQVFINALIDKVLKVNQGSKILDRVMLLSVMGNTVNYCRTLSPEELIALKDSHTKKKNGDILKIFTLSNNGGVDLKQKVVAGDKKYKSHYHIRIYGTSDTIFNHPNKAHIRDFGKEFIVHPKKEGIIICQAKPNWRQKQTSNV